MARGRDRDIRTDEGVVADLDIGIIDQGQKEVDVDVLPDADIFPCPVGVEGCFYKGTFSEGGEHLFTEFFSFFFFQTGEGIEGMKKGIPFSLFSL